MRCLNIAHAGTFVLAALVACLLSTSMGGTGWSVALAFLAAILVGIVLNLAVHLVALQPLMRSRIIRLDIEMGSFLATLGAFFILQTLALELTDGMAVPFNTISTGIGSTTVLGATLPLKYLVVAVAACASLAGVMAFMHSPRGRQLRATADNRMLASVLGIDIRAAQRLAMALAGGLAGLGGATIAYLYGQASFGLSEAYLIKSVVIGIVAGLGSLGGAAAVAIALGLVESFTTGLLGSSWRDTAAFIIVIAVLAVRPQGLFAKRQRLAT
jgi:branched-chain amino acid transport system permease protein